MNIPQGQRTLQGKLGQHIYNICKRDDVKNIVEIGTWYGGGTTFCVHEAIKGTDKQLISLEISEEMFNVAQNFYKDVPNIKIIKGKITDEQIDLDTLGHEHFTIYSKATQAEWRAGDQRNLSSSPNVLNLLPEEIDLLILDGGEYSSWFEYLALKDRSKIIIADDTRVPVVKNAQVRMDLLNTRKIIEDDSEGHGFIIAEKDSHFTATSPKIAIQTIIFNGEFNLPEGMLIKHLEQSNLLGDYVFITEGATRATTHYFDGDTSSFTSNGKSTDNTVAIIKDYIKDKPKFFFKESDGFWNGKTNMLNYWFDRSEILKQVDYVWQIDSDEFYHEDDYDKILLLLKEGVKRVDFFANHFWGDIDHAIDETSDGTWGNSIPWMRIFKINNGSRWITHEPPNMFYNGNERIVDKYETLRKGIKLYHYSYVDEKQVEFKHKFYRNFEKLDLWHKWQKDHSISIFGSKTVKFKGNHPKIIKAKTIPLI